MKNLTYYPIAASEYNLDEIRPDLNQRAIELAQGLGEKLNFKNSTLNNYGHISKYGEDDILYGTRLTVDKGDSKLTCFVIFENYDLEALKYKFYFSVDDSSDAISYMCILEEFGIKNFDKAMNNWLYQPYRILL